MTIPSEDSYAAGLSPEEKEFLRRDVFITAVLKQRGTEREKVESWWRFFLSSPGGTALISVLLGGVLAAWISAAYQYDQKERDVQHTLNQLRSSLIDEVLSIIGKVQGSAESRIEIDGKKYAKRIDPAAEKINASQKLSIRHAFNQAWQDWDTKKLSMLARIRFNLGANPATKWAKLITDVDSLLDCASAHVPTPSGDNLCELQLNAVKSSAENFISALKEVDT